MSDRWESWDEFSDALNRASEEEMRETYGQDVYDYDFDPVENAYNATWHDMLATKPSAQDDASFSQWEHELAQPDYPDYFLEEMTR